MNTDFEVIIVGAGPCGSVTALSLLSLDASFAGRTLLLDAKKHPREKICAGAITGRGVKALAKLGLEIKTPQVPINNVRVHVPGLTADGHHIGFGTIIRRDEFDAQLAWAARDRGMELRDGEKVTDVRRVNDGMEVVTTAETYRAKVVVAADGAPSTVRRALGFPQVPKMVRLYMVETPVDPERTFEFQQNAFTMDFTRAPQGLKGYVWDFPCYIDGKPMLNRGIFDNNPDVDGRVDLKPLFAECMAERGVDINEYPLKVFPERAYDPHYPASQPHVVLAGEALGIDPLFGEGITEAMEMGVVAAETIVEAFRAKDFTFADYTKRVERSKVGRELKALRRLAHWCYDYPSVLPWLFGFLARHQSLYDHGMKVAAGDIRPTQYGVMQLALRFLKYCFSPGAWPNPKRPRVQT